MILTTTVLKDVQTPVVVTTASVMMALCYSLMDTVV